MHTGLRDARHEEIAHEVGMAPTIRGLNFLENNVFIESLNVALTTEPTITAKLGTPSTRPDSTSGIFPTQAPDQPTMPYIVVSQVTGEPLSVTYDGTGPLTTERWRISCYGSTYRNAKVLAKVTRVFLLSFFGVAGDVRVQGAFCNAESDEAEPLGRGTLFCTHLEFTFNYIDSTN